jgi:hypothetical protein
MPARPQPGLGADKAVVKAVRDHAEGCLGVYGEVVRPGRVAEGDEVRVVPAAPRGALATAGGRVRAGVRRGVVRVTQRVMPRGR